MLQSPKITQRITVLSVAHSPDADDIFMYYAIALGWVNCGDLRFENVAKDIQTLNEETIGGIYDISAISFGLYPHIRNDYALLKTAVSFGQGYGPKLVKLKNRRLSKKFKVALSGAHTTNALLFRIAYPNARIVYKNFLDIEKAVIEGEVDAGVLIHESILGYDESLEVERELWDIWLELTGSRELPLPLGGMAIRRSLPLLKAIECERILTDAVRIAHNNKKILSKMLLERGLFRVDAKRLETYLNMYANENSITMNDTQLEAIDLLFDIGYRNKIYDAPLHVNDFLIPTHYKQIRFS